jgi:hypothetical protein
MMSTTPLIQVVVPVSLYAPLGNDTRPMANSRILKRREPYYDEKVKWST